ncbi:CoA transferase subunit A [Phytohabitans kaempferiae]|uniref:CoA transferase subunit A n=1 Tax=Phytohabitans kaempferiae TaxID=1620943 RepID=A0ABV6M9N3_9ACTN
MSRTTRQLASSIRRPWTGESPEPRTSKLVSLREAAALVPDRCRIAFGGQSVYQHPMAFVRELARQRRRELTVIGVLNGPELDLLVGAGAVAVVETSYVGLEQFGLAPNYRRAVEAGRLKVHDYSEVVAFDRFRASEAGWTFLPVYSLAGSDVMTGNTNAREMTCPFTGTPLQVVPAANVDVVVVHVGLADEYGNVLAPASRLVPQTFDGVMARASDRVIVTAERIVSNQFVRQHADLTVISGLRVEAVAHAPRGAHPCHSLGFYQLDVDHFERYLAASRSAEDFHAYLETYVYGPADNDAYLDLTPASRWATLETGTGLL